MGTVLWPEHANVLSAEMPTSSGVDISALYISLWGRAIDSQKDRWMQCQLYINSYFFNTVCCHFSIVLLSRCLSFPRQKQMQQSVFCVSVILRQIAICYVLLFHWMFSDWSSPSFLSSTTHSVEYSSVIQPNVYLLYLNITKWFSCI